SSTRSARTSSSPIAAARSPARPPGPPGPPIAAAAALSPPAYRRGRTFHGGARKWVPPRSAVPLPRLLRGPAPAELTDCPHGCGSRERDDEPLRAQVERRLVDLDDQTVAIRLPIDHVEALGLHCSILH